MSKSTLNRKMNRKPLLSVKVGSMVKAIVSKLKK